MICLSRGTTRQRTTIILRNYGNADFDTRHSISGYVLYDLPQLGRAIPRLTKGWELTTFWSYNSGFPFTVFSGLGDASSGSHTGNGLDRADLVGDPFRGIVQPPEPPGGPLAVQWVNSAAFAPNQDGTFGNTKRNQFYNPRFKTVDFSVIKNTSITERVKVQFRAEMFNVFNILNLGGTDNFSATLVSGASTARCTHWIIPDWDLANHSTFNSD
jgi:hypothetical protein